MMQSSQTAPPTDFPRHAWRAVLDIAASVGMLVAAGVVVWMSLRPVAGPTAAAVPVPREPIRVDGGPMEGSGSAGVVLIVFSDFQCPFCGRFAAETLPTLRTEYIETGRVRLVFRHLPLRNVHPLAWGAAETVECASRQDKFAEAHDALFAGPRLDQAVLMELPDRLALDRKVFDQCMQADASSRVQQDVDLAQSLGIQGTPLFLIGLAGEDGRVRVEQLIRGARPLADFRKVLDAVLAQTAGA